MTDRVLLVDDDYNVLSAYVRHLRKSFEILVAQGGEEALQILSNEGPFAVVVSDLLMPGMDGIELLGEVKRRSPDTVRMILTGHAELETAIEAVNRGSILRFYTKPCPPETLAHAVEAGLAQYRLITSERELLEQTLAGSVKVLTDVLSLVDPEAFGKARLLREWAREAARRLDLPNSWQLDMAAMLSPIGQITIPPETIAKVRAGQTLTSVEREMVGRMPEISRNLLANIPRLKEVGEIIYYQNKAFDGSGFPQDGVAGNDIPLGARVLKLLIDLAEVGAGELPDRAAFAELDKRRRLYDPEVLAALRSCFIDSDDAVHQPRALDIAKVAIDQLIPGFRLVSNIETESGQLVLAAGHTLSVTQVERLRNLRKVRRLKEPIHVLKADAVA